MKQNRRLLLGILGIVAMLIIAAALWLVYNNFKPETVKGAKEIIVDVVIPEEETEVFTLHTDAEFLSQALEEEKLIVGAESDYGLFITEVNGRKADDAKQEWWCITKGGEDVYTGADTTPIADGDHYELTLTVGY